ncbi:MAG: TolC family protein [Calditrichota bacterium]
MIREMLMPVVKNRTYVKRILLLLILAPLLVSSQALTEVEGKMSFDLNAARQYARQHNYDIQNSDLAINAAKKQIKEIAAGGFPQISGSAQYQDFLDIPTQLIPGEIFGGEPGSTIPVKFGKPHNATWGVSANQLIFSGSYFVGLQASKIYLNLTKQNMERSQLDVAETVTRTYYLILVAEENLHILEENLKNLQQLHYEVQESFKEGFVEDTDVKQLQISVTRLQNTVNTIRQQIEVTYKLLKFQMGLDLGQEIALIDNLESILSQVDVPSLLARQFDLHQNIGYRLASTQLSLARANLKNEKMQFLPVIAGFASYQQNAQRDKFDLFDFDKKWYPTAVVGLNINVPLFSSGAKLFRVQQAKIAVKQAEITRQKAEQGLQLQYEQARTDLTSNLENYKNAKANMALAKEVYDVTLEKYREGVSTSLDLIEVHNQYLTAQSAYITGESQLLNAKNTMDKLFENY